MKTQIGLASTRNADFFASAIEDTEALIVPSLRVYEVFKRVLQQRGEEAALQIAASMAQGRLVELDQTLALSAAKNLARIQNTDGRQHPSRDGARLPRGFVDARHRPCGL